MNERLIYDVGMNNGDDTRYYLSQGFNVVAIEANPELAIRASRELNEFIVSGRLKVLNLGIADQAGQLQFWVNSRKSEWSSFDRAIGCREDPDAYALEVTCLPLRDVFREYGVPWYLKVDIEGYDHCCVADLNREDLPEYVSVEANCVSLIRRLGDLGYRYFKCIDQFTHLPLEWPASWEMEVFLRTGRMPPRTANLKRGSSGEFGNNTLGRWYTAEEVLDVWNRYRTLDSAMTRFRIAHWCDFHAALSPQEPQPWHTMETADQAGGQLLATIEAIQRDSEAALEEARERLVTRVQAEQEFSAQRVQGRPLPSSDPVCSPRGGSSRPEYSLLPRLMKKVSRGRSKLAHFLKPLRTPGRPVVILGPGGGPAAVASPAKAELIAASGWERLSKIGSASTSDVQKSNSAVALSSQALGQKMDMALRHLRAKGFRPRCVLDIGAGRGYWSFGCSLVFSAAEYYMIDPLQENESHLARLCERDPRFHWTLTALGDHEGQAQVLVTQDLDGSSILTCYNEADSPYVRRTVPIVPADQLLAQGAVRSADLIRIDVQGAELKVLAGAERLLAEAEVVITEVNLFPFFPECPRIHQVVSYLAQRGFFMFDLAGSLRRPYQNDLGQLDVVFVKSSSPLIASNVWA